MSISSVRLGALGGLLGLYACLLFWPVDAARAQSSPATMAPALPAPVAELEGISPGVDKICDWRVKIPIVGRVQSMNVSAAGAVLMYEWARRSQVPGKP